MYGAVSAFRQRFFDRLARSFRTERDDDDFAAVLLFLAKRLLKRIRIGLAHFVADVAFIDPLLSGPIRNIESSLAPVFKQTTMFIRIP